MTEVFHENILNVSSDTISFLLKNVNRVPKALELMDDERLHLSTEQLSDIINELKQSVDLRLDVGCKIATIVRENLIFELMKFNAVKRSSHWLLRISFVDKRAIELDVAGRIITSSHVTGRVMHDRIFSRNSHVTAEDQLAAYRICRERGIWFA